MNRQTLLDKVARDLYRFGKCFLPDYLAVEDDGCTYGLLSVYSIDGKEMPGLGDSVNQEQNPTFVELSSLQEEHLEEIRRAQVRAILSHLLMDTDEEHPLRLPDDEVIVIRERNHESVGLSSNDLPKIDALFQMPGDGTLWFHVHGTEKDAWTDIEDADQGLDAYGMESLADAAYRGILSDAKKQKVKSPSELAELTQKAWDRISDKGPNVTYCESMDIELFSTMTDILLGDADKYEPKGLEDSLHFYAENSRYLPETFQNAPLTEILDYIQTNEESICRLIWDDLKYYLGEYDIPND